MTEMKSVDEILDFAIGNEQSAHDFYMGLAEKMSKPAIKKVFEGFAKEEAGHKVKLEAVKDGKKLLTAAAQVADLKIGDYLVAVEPEEEGELDYQQALIVAMKAEKAAFRLYSDLAAKVEDAGVKELFLGLAQEEAKHKLRFEVEYDEVILAEN